MNRTRPGARAALLLSPLALGLGCSTPPRIEPAEAEQAKSLEIQVDERGLAREVEYHVSPEAVPAAVHEAFARLHPGGRPNAAEREMEGAALYWELAAEVDGREVEAMFSPDGVLHSEEVEVAADTVPAAVRDSVAKAYGGATVRKWEEIRDGKQKLVEYHVKLVEGGKNHKIVVATDGRITAAFLEIPAEIEVPVKPR